MEIRELTALELGQKIRAGEVTSRQAVEAYLAAIDEKDSAVNAYITVLRDEALARADEIQKKIIEKVLVKIRMKLYNNTYNNAD